MLKLNHSDVVTLDIDLQEHLDSRMSHINMRKEWMTQITDSYAKWISTAAVSKPFPHSMLTLNDQHQVHHRFC